MKLYQARWYMCDGSSEFWFAKKLYGMPVWFETYNVQLEYVDAFKFEGMYFLLFYLDGKQLCSPIRVTKYFPSVYPPSLGTLDTV